MLLDKLIEEHLLDIEKVSDYDIAVYESALDKFFQSAENLDVYFWLFQKGNYRNCSESLRYVYRNFWDLHKLVLDIVSNIQSKWQEI